MTSQNNPEILREQLATLDHGPTSFIHNELADIKWLVSNARRKWKRRVVFAATQVYFAENHTDIVLMHILKHKWYMGEKGTVFRGSPEDMIIEAGRDWAKQGYLDAYLASIPRTQLPS